jgi:hypothetical protein
MAVGNATFTDFAGATQDYFGVQADLSRAQGDVIEGQEYGLAADLAGRNEEYTALSTDIKEAQESRSIYQTVSTQQANVAGAGFGEGGSAIDLLRDSASQGALAKATLGEQGLITEAGYNEQQQSYLDMQAAANMAAGAERTAATGMDITAAIRGAAGIATLLAAPATGGTSLIAGAALAGAATGGAP